MKSKGGTSVQTILGEYPPTPLSGYIRIYKYIDDKVLYYQYYDGSISRAPGFSNFFLNLDNQ